mgnify:FL=1
MAIQSSNKKIAKNTAFLYFRTLVLLGLSLYTSRITLQVLGVENYGIINVVSGFVSMFSLLSGSLTSACQRFITFELGKEDGNVSKVFSASFYIHVILAIIILLLAETLGVYFVSNKLNLPPNSMYAAKWLFQCSIVAFILNLINIPYNALIVAHERMKAFAYISLVEAGLKFLTVFLLLYFSGNRLIVYAIFTLISSTIVRSVYHIYCKSNFAKDCKIVSIKEHFLFKKIFSFAGWAFLGNSATLLTNQGVNMMLNMFLGVTLNAARGIATLVEGSVSNFTYSFTAALNPQITKSYAANQHDRLRELMDFGMRISFFLIVVISLPIIIATPNILNIWLGVYPEYTIIFIRITLLCSILQATANPLMTLIYATGVIKYYQLAVGLLVLLNLPLSWVLLRFNFSPTYIYVLNLIIYAITFIVRLAYIKYKLRFRVGFIFKMIVFRMLPIICISALISFYFYNTVINMGRYLGLFLFSLESVLTTILLAFIIGMNGSERTAMISQVKRILVNKFAKY